MKKYLKNMFINIKETFDETYEKISEDGLLLGQKRFVAAVKSDEQHTEGGTITTYKIVSLNILADNLLLKLSA